jgi:hypothetical protein
MSSRKQKSRLRSTPDRGTPGRCPGPEVDLNGLHAVRDDNGKKFLGFFGACQAPTANRVLVAHMKQCSPNRKEVCTGANPMRHQRD